MNIYDAIKRQHRQFETLADQICETTEKDMEKRAKLFAQLMIELNAHSRGEEKTLYPALEKHRQTEFKSLESQEEHHALDLLLGDISSVPKNSKEWLPKFRVIKENMMHHIREEESDLFPKAMKILNEEEAEWLGGRFERNEAEELHFAGSAALP